jgi:hypothetical protein
MAAPGCAAWGNGVVVHSVWGVELVYEIQAAAVDDLLYVCRAKYAAAPCVMSYLFLGAAHVRGGGSLLRASAARRIRSALSP